MDPVTMAMIGQAAAPVLGGLVGSIFGSDDREAAQANIAKAVQGLQALGLPPDTSKEVILNHFKQAGIYTPQLEQDLGTVTSKLGEYKEDQGLKNVQADALAQLAQRSKQGLSPEDLVALNQIKNKAQSDAEGQKQSVMQQMAARGMGGAGNELVAQLAAGQNAANQEANQGLNLAAQAQQAAANAIQQRAALAGAMRGQDLTAAQAAGNAADIMARFNQENSMGRQQRNVGALNQAQQANLASAQSAADRNTAAANQELYRQQDAARQFYNDKLNYQNSVNNALAGQATALNQQADRTANRWAGVGAALGQGFGAYGNYQQNQKTLNSME